MSQNIDQQIAWERGLVSRISRLEQKPPRTSEKLPPFMLDDIRIAKAVRFIELTPTEKTTLLDVAAHVGLSPFHLQRIFQDVMGESPATYTRRTRLDRAAMNLQMSGEAITHVALNAGYASHEAFVRGFYRQFGAVPSQFRAMAQQALPAKSESRLASAEPAFVEQWEDIPLRGIRFYGPMGIFEQHWQKFYAYVSSKGIDVQRVQAVGILHDTPNITPDAYFRHDCAIVDRGLDLKDDLLQPILFRGGRYVRMRHRKPYDRIIETCAAVSIDWLADSGEAFLSDSSGGFKFYNEPPWRNIGKAHDLNLVLPLV